MKWFRTARGWVGVQVDWAIFVRAERVSVTTGWDLPAEYLYVASSLEPDVWEI